MAVAAIPVCGFLHAARLSASFTCSRRAYAALPGTWARVTDHLVTKANQTCALANGCVSQMFCHTLRISLCT
jgi:hypothetical protein